MASGEVFVREKNKTNKKIATASEPRTVRHLLKNKKKEICPREILLAEEKREKLRLKLEL